jgi:hypothetical protein
MSPFILSLLREHERSLHADWMDDRNMHETFNDGEFAYLRSTNRRDFIDALTSVRRYGFAPNPSYTF